jgi:NitT/TauT family transport system substrate-binding protein
VSIFRHARTTVFRPAHRTPPTHIAAVATIAVLAVVTAACSSGSTASDSSSTSAAAASSAAKSDASSAGSAAAGSAAAPLSVDTLRLGYFPNVTHASAVLGVADGTFQDALGDTKLETSTFNAGPAAIEALLSGAIDATFIGPSPAINAYAKSNGDALRIVSGATDNGAALVVKTDINGPADLAGKTLATPQLGGTQDVALRKWLLDNGLKTQTTGGTQGDADYVDIVSQDNSQTLDLFKQGAIDGAWLPEPWASRLVLEAGAKTLVDEKTLWPDQKFQTTILISSRQFLEDHPDAINALIKGEVTETEKIEADPTQAQTDLNTAIAGLTGGKPLADSTIQAAFGNIEPTWDPLASTLNDIAKNGVTAGTLASAPDLSGIYDLRELNKVLVAAGKPPVSAASLGQE